MKKVFGFIRHYYLFFAALVSAGVALGLDLSGMDTAAHWLLISTCVLELIPLLWGMVQDLRNGKYGVDILAATAIVSALLFHEYWAATVIVLMLTGGEALEDYAGHRADREMEALLKRSPTVAHILRGRKIIDVKASQVQEGDKIIIRPGEMVPADAKIIDGSASFDESSLTGESLPVAKTVDDDILSGAVNQDGAVTAIALHAAKDSQYAQIIKLVKSARNSQAPFIRLADRYAVPFTLCAFAIAIAAWLISGDSLRFLQVIVVATPCPLILAAPIAIISGMSRAAKHGIIVKNGGSLERLAGAKTFAFDKTGTLTKGELKTGKIAAMPGFKPSEILAIAASAEQHSNHIQGQAILAKATENKSKISKTKNVREIAGKGIVATVQGKTVLVGQFKLLEDHKVELPKDFKKSEHLKRSAAFVAVNGKLAGVISFEDSLRDDAVQTLTELKKSGIKDFMLVTGDNAAAAESAAKKLEIKNVVHGALPGDKIRAIENVPHKPVAFVGDGVNDAPVLTSADVGIALGAKGSAAASESADVVIMLDELSRVARAVQIAKRTFGIAEQSILVGISLSVILMLIFATGKFKPVYGAAIQELVDIVVIFNALRAHGGGKKSS